MIGLLNFSCKPSNSDGFLQLTVRNVTSEVGFLQGICILFLAVVLDSSGKSKGFGFVRFSEETDQQRALIEMQHMTGIGRRPIKVGLAAPKRYTLNIKREGFFKEWWSTVRSI